MKMTSSLSACALGALCLASLPQGALAQNKDQAPQKTAAERAAEYRGLQEATKIAAAIATDLASVCPIADPSDEKALAACRQGAFHGSVVRDHLDEFIAWGRQSDPNARLKDTNLTQFGPDVFTGVYLSQFMFTGKSSVEYVEREKLYRMRLQVAFRNRLPPGAYAYPFWHNENKWAMYQNANEIQFWWDARKAKIRFGQFTPKGALPSVMAVTPVKHEFEGKWLWTDAQGKTQPKATLFDGLFEPNNPHLARIETTYKALALRMRDSQCNDCHVPNNPDEAKRLVLLQTPLHAASEIKRLLKAVKADKMPRDEFGVEQPLPHKLKAALLEEGIAFDRALDDAKRWEMEKGAALRQARSPLPRTTLPALTDPRAPQR